MSEVGTICICIGVALIILLIILYLATENNHANSREHSSQSRTNGPIRRTQTGRTSLPPLPPRVPPANVSRTAVRTELPRKPVIEVVRGNTGANGVNLYQFPCCPIDKQRNIPGKAQLISWDMKNECYVCSSGHRFQRNGKPIYA